METPDTFGAACGDDLAIAGAGACVIWTAHAGE
jgi:hypothetical protein